MSVHVCAYVCVCVCVCVCVTALVNEWGDVDDGESSPSHGGFAGFPVEGSAYQMPSPQAAVSVAAAAASPGTAITVVAAPSEAPTAVALTLPQTFANIPPPVVLALPPMPALPTGPSFSAYAAASTMPMASSLALLPRTRRMRTPTAPKPSAAGVARESPSTALPKFATLPSFSPALVECQSGASSDQRVQKPAATYRQVSTDWGTSSSLSPASSGMSPVVPPGHTHLCMHLETEPPSGVVNSSSAPSATDGTHHVEPGTPMNAFGSPSASRLRVPRPMRRSWGPGMAVVPDGDMIAANPPAAVISMATAVPVAGERLPSRAHIVPRQPGPPVAPSLPLAERAPAPMPESPGLLSSWFQSVKKSFTSNSSGAEEPAEESNKENSARLPPCDYTTRPAPVRQGGGGLRPDKPKVGATRKMMPRAGVGK